LHLLRRACPSLSRCHDSDSIAVDQFTSRRFRDDVPYGRAVTCGRRQDYSATEQVAHEAVAGRPVVPNTRDVMRAAKKRYGARIARASTRSTIRHGAPRRRHEGEARYAHFTEGFASADLEAATALLSSLL